MHPVFDIPPADSALQPAFEQLQQHTPRLRQRDLAAALSCSEAELVDSQLSCRRIRLDQNFPELIAQLHTLGYIMTLTRNEAVVHERKGCYPEARVSPPVGLIIADDRKVDLRILLNHWRFGFAVAETHRDNIRFSLQFFDSQGQAVQKIYLQPESHFDAYIHLVNTFRHPDQDTPMVIQSPAETPVLNNDQQVDVQQLSREWAEMTDVHQFFGMLKRHKVSRPQAFRLVGERWAQAFAPDRIQPLLEQAAAHGIPIMCFAGNRGNIQIHSGPVHRIKTLDQWLNVLDPEFNLHIDMDRIASAWLVRKPTCDGIITSIELYLDNGETAAQFFGVRLEGQSENLEWRQLAESMLNPEQVCA